VNPLQQIIGLQLKIASYAGNTRTFIFSSAEPEWSLQVQCPWRIEHGGRIVTGSDDWWDPGAPDSAMGGSLQQTRLREIFRDEDSSSAVLYNHTTELTVEHVQMGAAGDVEIGLSGGYRLRIFPAGSRGEDRRLFRNADPGSRLVWPAEQA